MTQCVITLTERSNRVINIIKAMNGFKDKSQAVNKILEEYEADLDLPLKEKFVEEMLKIQNDKSRKYINFNSIEDFDKHFSKK